MMETKNIEKIRSLRGAAKATRTFWEKYKSVAGIGSCDKYEAKFCGDDRFQVFSKPVYFSSLLGYYGNSGCSTFTNGMSSEVVSDYFVKALNKNKELIFKDMADLMAADAASLTDAAEKEVAALNEMLESAKSEAA